ncbi:MAG: antitoxin Xre/MbcA/ParS toxin-binding domain-containing protein [Marinomonas sp.]
MSIRTFKPSKVKQDRGLMAGLSLSADPASAAAQIGVGFYSDFISRIITKSKIAPSTVRKVIGVNRATIVRHEQGKRWVGDTAVKAYMGARLLDVALLLFGNDKDKAAAWLEKPAMALGGISPANYATKPLGQEALIDLIVSVG